MTHRHTGLVLPIPGGLVKEGPLVGVTLGPHAELAKEIRASGKPVPAVTAKMMVDTGAQQTVVDKAIADQLGLTPVRFQRIVGVSQQPELRPVYRMAIQIGFADATGQMVQIVFSSDLVGMASPPAGSASRGLIGRDFLQHFEMFYDGPNGSFELRVPTLVKTPSIGAGSAGPGHGGSANKDKRKQQRKARRRNRR